MLAVHGPKLLAPLLNICEQNSWQPLYLAVNNQSILLQLLQELSASREAGEIDLSLKLIAKARQLGFQSHWINDNEARALVHLDRLQEAVALWRHLESSSDPAIVATAAEMLTIFSPQLEREKLENQAEYLLEIGDAAAAENLLLNALLQDLNYNNYRLLLERAIAVQLDAVNNSLVANELFERQLNLEVHARLLTALEKNLA